MKYRSLSFHRATIPDPELIERGARVGFNDITFQTELGGTVKAAERFAERAAEEGYFDLADEYDMTTTLWAHEFDNYDPSWGPIALDNRTLWERLAERYDRLLSEVVPELDYLALTLVESDYWATDTPLVEKLVDTVHRACRDADTTLIFRTFVRKPEESRSLADAVPSFPDDVVVMNKYVPQDWYVRNVKHPLIGAFDDRTEFVEIDLANEYARLGHLSNCFTDEIAEHVDHWEDNDVDGVAARVYRDNSVYREGLPEGRRSAWRHDVLNEPEEANLWALGRLTSGEEADLDEIWREYAEHAFGEAAAETMIDVLRPTGDVVEEAFFVKDLNFGTVKWNGVSRARIEEGRIPAHRTMMGFWHHSIYAREFDDERAASQLMINPFARKTSRWFWDESYEPTYHRIRKGHPDVIARKEAAYADALETADRSLDLLESVADELEGGRYDLLEFKLEENRYNLVTMCEMELAWLKASNRLYLAEDDERDAMEREMKSHLANLEELIGRYGESVEAEWQGDVYYKERGEYVDIVGFLHEFRRHWQLDDYRMFSDAFPAEGR